MVRDLRWHFSSDTYNILYIQQKSYILRYRTITIPILVHHPALTIDPKTHSFSIFSFSGHKTNEPFHMSNKHHPPVQVQVKWGKEQISLTFSPDQGVKSLKAQLEQLTNVPSDRMKLMPKSKGLWKGILKDDFDLNSIDFASIKPPIQFLLMGSASQLTGPKVQTVFVEDLPPEEAAKVAPEPSGLVNLGNTCYMNSVVQCLRAVPVFRQVTTSLHRGGAGTVPSSGDLFRNSELLRTLGGTFLQLDHSAQAVSPMSLVVATKRAFPQFSQMGPHGQPMQQDAEEFFSGLLEHAARYTKGKVMMQHMFFEAGVNVHEEEMEGVDNLVDALFGILMEETYTCDETQVAGLSSESDDATTAVEPAVVRNDLHRKLVCNIQGGSDASSQTNVTHIMEGISLALNGKVEKDQRCYRGMQFGQENSALLGCLLYWRYNSGGFIGRRRPIQGIIRVLSAR
jgi:Isopeptidase T